jgi:hypothetical protein
MGRRSRRRDATPAATAAPSTRDRPSPPAVPAPPRRLATERPPAPWDPFPLTELCVLLGLVLLVWGLLRRDDPAGRVLLVCGMVLGSLGGLETALREHFGGGRSHSTLLAALPAVLVAGVLFFARAPWVLAPVAAALVFAAAFTALRRSRRQIAPPGRLG